MAAEDPQHRENAEWGYVPTSTSVVDLDDVSVGFLSGPIDIISPREYAFQKLDQDTLDLAGVMIKRDFFVGFVAQEILLLNITGAWDSGDEETTEDPPDTFTPNGILNIDDDLRGLIDIDITVSPPNSTKSNDTRIIAVPTAQSVGDGAYSLPYAAVQTLAHQYRAIADDDGLLATVTDAYPV